jgi:hypothetical protein
MNLSALPELLLAWVRNQGAALLGSDQQDGRASPFKSGAQYDGKVLDNLANGRHLVQVAGQKLDMALPRNTQPGDTVRLTYLSGGPRPTFLFNQTAQAQSTSAAQPVSISSTAQQVNALVRFVGPAVAMNSGNTRAPLQRTVVTTDSISVSGAHPSNASVLTASLGAARSAGQSAITPAMENSSSGSDIPAMASSTRAIASTEVMGKLAGAAASAVATSSHPIASAEATGKLPGSSSAAMVSSARPVAANVVMLQNFSASTQFAPSGAVSPNTALVGQVIDGLRAAIPSSTTLTPNVLAELSGPSRNLLPTRLFQTLSESGLFYEAHLARWAKGGLSFESILREPQARFDRENLSGIKVAELGGMADEAARLAGKQLQLLEGAPFLWQGFAWPGQWMEWQVEERQPEGEGGESEESATQWVTELRLNLPRLGGIHAHIGLKGNRIDLRLDTQDEAVRKEMLAAMPMLAKEMEAAGLRPASLSVDIPNEA